jgi:hypothetical protein
MIIFYNKQTGRIIGTIEGRIHSDEQLKMWIGSREDNDRLVFDWGKNDEGVYKPKVNDKQQMEILEKVDKDPASIYNFAVDITTKDLTSNDAK